MRLPICRSVVLLFLLSSIVRAESPAFNLNDSMITVSGSVHMGMGEVMRGMYRSMINGQAEQEQSWPATVTHAWFGEPEAMLNLAFRPHEMIRVQIGCQGNIFLNTFPAYLKSTIASNGGPGVLPQYMSWTLHQAQGTISLLDKGAMSLGLSLGVMPYKYNPEVRNLGEFMFRSGTYPFFLINSYDFPLARLSGLRLNYKYGNDRITVAFDQFVLSERTIPPFYDVSLASMFSVRWGRLIECGAGVDFARIFSVNSELTTPNSAKYANSPGDTTGHYTFKGTKVMARLTVDPCGTIRGDNGSFISQVCGENGGKAYGEIAVIGLKNYPVSLVKTSTDPRDAMNQWGYTKISERMPWMVGINIPMWKILDVCAFEIEKYPAPYPNDYFQVVMDKGLPVPTWYHVYRDTIMPVRNSSGGYDTIPWNMPYDSAVYQNRWYWSLYMKKKVAEHFSLTGQISRDHMRWDINLGNKLNNDTEEIMVKPGEWSWRFGVLLEF